MFKLFFLIALKRNVFCLGLLLLCSLSTNSISETLTSSAQKRGVVSNLSVKFDKQKKLLSVKSDAISLEELTDAISQKTGIVFELLEPKEGIYKEKTHQFAFQNLPIKQGIETILQKHSHIITYEKIDKANQIASIFVLPYGKENTFSTASQTVKSNRITSQSIKNKIQYPPVITNVPGSIYYPRPNNQKITYIQEKYNGVTISYISDELLIRINPNQNINARIRVLDTIVKQFGGVLADRMHRLKYFKARFPLGSDLKALQTQLAQHDFIQATEPNYIAKLSRNRKIPTQDSKNKKTQPPSLWHLQAINAIIDSSTKSKATTHHQYQPKIAIIDSGVDDSITELKGKVKHIIDTVNNDNNANDDNGHGTAMALLALQVAPNAKIHAIKVANAEGIATYADIAEGIFHALDRKIDVINLSLGDYAPSQILQDAMQFAYAKGVNVVASAGNDGYTGKAFYPATYANVIGVGVVDKNNQILPQSNRGDFVDIVAPGHNIQYQINGKTHQSNGTSAAAALISGAIAKIQTNNRNSNQIKQPPATIAGRIYETAQDLLSKGNDQATGYGLIDLISALRLNQPKGNYQEPFQPRQSYYHPLDGKQLARLMDFDAGEVTEWLDLRDQFATSHYDKMCGSNSNATSGTIMILKDLDNSHSIGIADFGSTSEEGCADADRLANEDHLRLYVFAGMVKNLQTGEHKSLNILADQSNLKTSNSDKRAEFDFISMDAYGVRQGGDGAVYNGLEWTENFSWQQNDCGSLLSALDKIAIGDDVVCNPNNSNFLTIHADKIREQLYHSPSHLLYSGENYYWDPSQAKLIAESNSKALGNRTPIILIHGWQGKDDKWATSLLMQHEVQAWWKLAEYNEKSVLLHDKTPLWGNKDTGSNHKSYFEKIDLGKHSKVYYFRYPTMRSNEYNAKRLAQLIKSHPELKNANNIRLIGHSTGGLLAKYIMLGYGDVDSINSKVTQVITLATPHRGSYSAFDFDTNFTEALYACDDSSDYLDKLSLYNNFNKFVGSMFVGNQKTDGAIDLAWDGGWGKTSTDCNSSNHAEKPKLRIGDGTDQYKINTKLKTINSQLLANNAILDKFIMYAGWVKSGGPNTNGVGQIPAAAAVDEIGYNLDSAVPLPSGLLFKNGKDSDDLLATYQTEAKKSPYIYSTENRRIVYDRDHSQMREPIDDNYSIDPLMISIKNDLNLFPDASSILTQFTECSHLPPYSPQIFSQPEQNCRDRVRRKAYLKVISPLMISKTQIYKHQLDAQMFTAQGLLSVYNTALRVTDLIGVDSLTSFQQNAQSLYDTVYAKSVDYMYGDIEKIAGSEKQILKDGAIAIAKTLAGDPAAAFDYALNQAGQIIFNIHGIFSTAQFIVKLNQNRVAQTFMKEFINHNGNLSELAKTYSSNSEIGALIEKVALNKLNLKPEAILLLADEEYPEEETLIDINNSISLLNNILNSDYYDLALQQPTSFTPSILSITPNFIYNTQKTTLTVVAENAGTAPTLHISSLTIDPTNQSANQYTYIINPNQLPTIGKYTSKIQANSQQSNAITLSVIAYNARPNQPSITAPSNGQQHLSPTAKITASTYSDPNNKTHQKTLWAIKTATGKNHWHTIQKTTNLTQISIPANILETNTSYTLYVRYYNSYQRASLLSPPVHIRTLSALTSTPITPTNPTTLITNISPQTATLNQLTTFTITGNNLPNGMGFSIAQCENVQEFNSDSSTQKQFQCTPSRSTGSKQGVIRQYPGDIQSLLKFSINVQAPSTTSPTPPNQKECKTLFQDLANVHQKSQNSNVLNNSMGLASAIQNLCSQGMISGYKKNNKVFVYPNATINKAELIKILALSTLHTDDELCSLSSVDLFDDVESNHWYYPHICKLIKAGSNIEKKSTCLLKPLGTNAAEFFCPSDPLHYSEVAKIILDVIFPNIPIKSTTEPNWFDSYMVCANSLELFSSGEYLQVGSPTKDNLKTGKSYENVFALRKNVFYSVIKALDFKKSRKNLPILCKK